MFPVPSLSTKKNKNEQFRSPRHPVVACVLEAYDLEVSTLNECIMLSKGNGYGGIDCVLETLEACTLKVCVCTASVALCGSMSSFGGFVRTPSAEGSGRVNVPGPAFLAILSACRLCFGSTTSNARLLRILLAVG